jgi:methionyl-tRNA formyltransferase
MWNGKRLKILRTEFDTSEDGNSGTYIIKDNEFLVYCQHGFINLVEIQLQDKKAMRIEDFLKGFRGETKGKFD